ncbi:DUF6636 domain-containing protein [Miltoncostaea marina]|uniref:DUF6636 domain-containing protein n=1 Tax=Miltoncostaea marina TaxID=2843215 RepID=UPI001C3DCF3F|nr:DUF6636 domain-containing protein [Miltoncostaea marina]
MRTRRRRHLVAGLAAAALLGAGASSAAGYVQFKAPSGNIGCAGDRTEVRCDIARTSATPPKKPTTCRFDWGHAYVITAKGKRGRGLCASDTVLPSPGQPGVRTIRYGTRIRLGRIVCISRRSGFTCRNAGGHGFTLSRERIRLF